MIEIINSRSSSAETATFHAKHVETMIASLCAEVESNTIKDIFDYTATDMDLAETNETLDSYDDEYDVSAPGILSGTVEIGNKAGRVYFKFEWVDHLEKTFRVQIYSLIGEYK